MSASEKNQDHTNRLRTEKSPYLQQHATNPVDWYAWGPEAFEEAERRDVPIFLSIGYATCHWCHVMERESFEDEQTAALMNRLFVNVKVDREERPDVDAIYMGAAQALTGQGGWPLSVWLTPDRRLPFYAGTYFPPVSMYGRPGFRELLAALSQAWDNDRERVLDSAGQITEAISHGMAVEPVGFEPEVAATRIDQLVEELVPRGVKRLVESFDPEYGGFGPAPKFPRPSVLFFLLDASSSDLQLPAAPQALLDMAGRTLRGMSLGGIHDHLAGGFARYSVDRFWRVPHFEKMLYDQGQILESLARLFSRNGDELLEARIRSTIAYLQRDMVDDSGLYFAAEDADSEGEEGTFYVWTEQEIDSLLDDLDAGLLKRRYDVSPGGNFEDGKNVLHIVASIGELADEFGLDRSEVESRLSTSEERLVEVRNRRERPLRDSKIIASWNGLLLSGLAWSARVLDDDALYLAAGDLAHNLMERMWDGDDLMRRIVDGERRYRAYLEDYAHLAKGLIDLYDVRQDPIWIDHAVHVVDRAIDLFEDPEGGGFFMTDGRDDELPIRTKSDHDGAEPSGNSAMAWSLARLSRLLDFERYRRLATGTVLSFGERVRDYPDVMPMLLSAALHLRSTPSSTVVVASPDDAEGFERITNAARRRRGPFEDLILIGVNGPDPVLATRLPYLQEMKPIDGSSVVYRCSNFTCGLPMTELPE